MSELLTCPFCGSEVRVRNWSTDYINLYTIECDACTCVCPATEWFDTEQQAIAAWNTRSEVNPDTATAFGAKSYRNGYANGYKDALKQRAERTCKNTPFGDNWDGKSPIFECSECGWDNLLMSDDFPRGDISYCPNCGARVEGD